MNVSVHGHNLKINQNLEDYVTERLDRLDRYLPNISAVWVDLSRQHTRRGEDLMIAQITVRHSRGAILRAEERLPGDIQVAVNLAVDKIYRQIQRFKGKRRNRKAQERYSASSEELNIAEAIPDVDLFEETEEVEQQIIRRKKIPIMAMNEDEAIEQMELLGHTFFVFFNDDSGNINVLYKRSAGGYGLLLPEMD